MTKKIKLLTVLAIAVILIASSITISVINEKQIDVVSGTQMTENSENLIAFSWNCVKKAEGYHIYLFNDETGAFDLLDDVEGEENCSYRFDEAESAKIYKVKVTAFKHFNKKEYESETGDEITVYTMPDTVEAKAYSSKEGELDIKWTAQENVAGYDIAYSKNEDFSESEVKNISPEDAGLFKVEGLEPKDVYYVRLRSFILFDDENIYGSWSETCSAEIKDKTVIGADIDPNKPMVALSFDDGPGIPDGKEANSTMRILEVLEKNGARATFFMCASRINDLNKDCLKKELELGCELGNHTYSHKRYGRKVTSDDISDCSDRIKEVSGQAPTIFRCPGGTITSVMQDECIKEGMPLAYWSVDTEDWKSRDAEKIYKKTFDNVYDGSIILMHDIYSTTADAIEKIVPKLIEDGYQVVTVTEMLTVKNGGKTPEPGQQYVDYKTINNNTK